MIKKKTAAFLRVLCVSAFLLPLAATPAFGWGEEGHRIVADIGEKYLNAKARAAVKQLLHDQPLADVANFAAAWRNYHDETGPWHFVDIPLAATNYDAGRDCAPHHGCVLEQLGVFKKEIADPQLTQSNRAFALKFIVHLVGDLHQPLHCVDNDDRGGNSVAVKLFGVAKKSPTAKKPWNLHSVWDSGLIEHTGMDEKTYVTTLTANLTAPKILAWQAGTTTEWALQSHTIATQIAYKIPADGDLGEDYFKKAKPALDACLLKGGVRLARVLNETLGK